MAITVAASLLEDVAASIYTSSTGDTGGAATYASPVVVTLDKFSLEETITTADHSAAQDLMELHRTTKATFTLTLGFKYGTVSGAGTTLSKIRAGQRIKVATAVALDSTLGRIIEGIVTKNSQDLAGPSTGELTIMPYGVVPTVAT